MTKTSHVVIHTKQHCPELHVSFLHTVKKWFVIHTHTHTYAYTMLFSFACLQAPVFLPGKSHGRRSLVGCSSSGHYKSDTTEWLHFHFSLSHIGEGNGNPLQCSCHENPRDGEPGGLPSMGLHRVRHDWSNLAAASSVNSFATLFFTQNCFWDELS